MTKFKIISVLMTLMVVIGALSACSNMDNNGSSAGRQTNNEDNQQENNRKYSIVSTIFPQYDWVRQIIGENSDNYELTLLLDNGVDLHNYQPTTDDIIKISSCDMFIYVGGESDSWVEDVLKNATNEDMVVINLLDVLGDSVKEEEIKEGMQHDHEHTHGVEDFEDDEVQDRSLSDWAGEWQSVYPYLLDGSFDEVMEHKANEGDKTANEYYEYYKTGYETNVEKIEINDNSITFTKDSVASTASYEYKGFEILTYESGSKGVRYQFEAVGDTNGAPRYVQLSDHIIEPSKSEHFHIYFGDEGFDALLNELDNWPTYYEEGLSGIEIAKDMIAHEHENELDEHVWLSLKNAKKITSYIAEKLVELDAKNASFYEKNLNTYHLELESLDKKYQEVVESATCKTLLFGDRFPFRYLVDDYGLDYYAAFSGCSAETEASFETIVFLSNKLDELKLKNIMVIETSDQSIAKTIAQNSKGKNQSIFTMDSMQSVTTSDITSGVSYLSIMESNLDVLKDVLN